MSLRRLFCISVILLGGVNGCSIVDNNEGRSFYNAEIVPGVGVEGILIGATIKEVQEVTGALNLCAIADGVGASWKVACLDESSPLYGLSMYFLEGSSMQNRPVANGALESITIEAPYAGKTSQGIGIGASQEAVKEAFGEPEYTQRFEYDFQPPIEVYKYCFRRQYFRLIIQEGGLISMGLGAALPGGECG